MDASTRDALLDVMYEKQKHKNPKSDPYLHKRCVTHRLPMNDTGLSTETANMGNDVRRNAACSSNVYIKVALCLLNATKWLLACCSCHSIFDLVDRSFKH